MVWIGLMWFRIGTSGELANTVTNLRIPWNAWKFLCGCTIGGFLRRAQFHEWVMILLLKFNLFTSSGFLTPNPWHHTKIRPRVPHSYFWQCINISSAAHLTIGSTCLRDALMFSCLNSWRPGIWRSDASSTDSSCKAGSAELLRHSMT
jgi:hypothetical protein